MDRRPRKGVNQAMLALLGILVMVMVLLAVLQLLREAGLLNGE